MLSGDSLQSSAACLRLTASRCTCPKGHARDPISNQPNKYLTASLTCLVLGWCTILYIRSLDRAFNLISCYVQTLILIPLGSYFLADIIFRRICIWISRPAVVPYFPFILLFIYFLPIFFFFISDAPVNISFLIYNMSFFSSRLFLFYSLFFLL